MKTARTRRAFPLDDDDDDDGEMVVPFVPLENDHPSPTTFLHAIPLRYCTSEQADKVLYPHCPREFRVMDYRMQMVAREIRGHAADLIMLQVLCWGGGGDCRLCFVVVFAAVAVAGRGCPLLFG